MKLAGNDLSGSLPKAWPSGGIRDSLRELDVAQNKIAGGLGVEEVLGRGIWAAVK